ncbi:MAG: short-chain dehydrogenase/reductase [Actinomycetia bacterium]|nr:short-chain dehydrogenase/reductase [Actinomycetes bacterium]
MGTTGRPLALVTGAGRRIGIGAAIARKLAETGWDIAFTYWPGYDERMPWGRDDETPAELTAAIEGHGGRAIAVEADLTDPSAASRVFGEAGDVRGLVLSHAESVDSGILDTTVESFDRHFAVNARASWLLIREFARQFTGPHGTGRIVALTSDHTTGNLPYGASKGALDRIVIAAATELRGQGITANVVNPGPVDTGWISPALAAELVARTPLGRLGRPEDTASLVAFLCSPAGAWINGQLLYSNGGFH